MIPRLGYVPGDSWVHRLDPRTKLLALLSTLVIILLFPDPLHLSIILALILALFVFSKLSLAMVVRKTRFFLIFGFLIFFSYLIFMRNGQLIWSMELFDLWDRTISLSFYEGGFWGGIAVALRFLDIVLSSLLFVAVTNPSKMAHALMRSGLPYRYGFMLIIALRFIPLFDMESSVVQNAQRARGLDIDVKGLRRIWRLAKHTFMPLLASALSRVDAISMSMDARGFGYSKKRTYLKQVKMQGADWTLTILVLLVTSFLVLQRLSMLPSFPFP